MDAASVAVKAALYNTKYVSPFWLNSVLQISLKEMSFATDVKIFHESTLTVKIVNVKRQNATLILVLHEKLHAQSDLASVLLIMRVQVFIFGHLETAPFSFTVVAI